MRRLCVALVFLLFSVAASAKTLTKITVLPPTDGYHITSNVGTVQLGTLCTYDDASTDNCAGITLTWGSGDPANITVNSSGLATGAGGSTGIKREIYAYDPITKILGHHVVNIDSYSLTSLTSRPETTSSTIVVGNTILVSAVDSSNNPAGDFCAWTTSDPTKATVNNIGEVTGIAAGTATITCTLNGHTVGRTVTVYSPTLTSNTWYVRPDGGTRYDAAVTTGQCSGLTNAAYPGSGTNQACAFSNPMYLFTDETSSSVYTGAVQPGDTAIIATGTTPYLMGGKNSSTTWITNSDRPGAVKIPSGTIAQPTRILSSNYASITTDPDHAGNRTMLQAYYNSLTFDLRGTQNVDIEGIDLGSYVDCNGGVTNALTFACPNSIKGFGTMSDSFTSNVTIKNSRIHGFLNATTGTPGPGTIFTNVVSQFNYLTGFNFDNPFGFNGNRTDGFTGVGLESDYSGFSESQPKTLASVSRDGAGNLTVNFAAGQVVNYLVGTNLVLQGMTPSDLNGTFPVSSITFNQQSVSITGGSCTVEPGELHPGPQMCVLTTSTAPAFGVGAFVEITGSPTTLINGHWEVFAVSGTGFSFNVSPSAHAGWGADIPTIASGGTAAVATSLIATATGASESASIVGTATFVHPAHRGLDQGSGGYANGDGVGTGNNTIGTWKCDKCVGKNNLQDFWDMLHSAMTRSEFTHSLSIANEGAAAKFGNTDVGIFNSNVQVATGGAMLVFNPDFPADYNQYIAMPYRASDAFPISSHPWSHMSISNVTWLAGFNTIMDDSCSDPVGCTVLPTLGTFVIQNSLFIGFMDSNQPGFNSSLPGVHFSEGGNPTWTWLNNAGYNVRNGPAGTNNQWSLTPSPVVATIPNISTLAGESAALTFNVTPKAGSAVIGAGVENADVPATDQVGFTMSNPPVIGGLMYQSGVLDTITVTPSSGSTTVGGTAAFSASCLYSDGGTTPCVVTWTDTAAHSSVNSTTGVVTGVSVGSDMVTATINTVFGTATVTISAAPTFFPMRGASLQGRID